jgi:aconitate hydratase
VAGQVYRHCSLRALEVLTGKAVSRMPFCLKVLLENVVRHAASDRAVDDSGIAALLDHGGEDAHGSEICFRPERVMMDDTAGLPLLGDLAAMRDALAATGLDPSAIDPVVPVDFVVDHSIIAEHAGTGDALARNVALEFDRNGERFAFLRWAEQAFTGLRVVPPGGGICHQVNLEHLAQVVRRQPRDDGIWLFADSMVGIDSHTPMINALGIAGWGVSGIEGTAAALGEPVILRVPPVVGIRLTGRLRPGITATDLALTLVQTIRGKVPVGAFVEYCGPGLDHLDVPERATVANMSPECGVTMSFFPVDAQTIRYLRQTGRSPEHVALVEAHARAQGLWRNVTTLAPRYGNALEFDLATVEPSLAGPGQPHQRVGLGEVPAAFRARNRAEGPPGNGETRAAVQDGDVVIAAITSCTNTSNPAGMIGAGLLARNALRRGMRSKPWVKTSLSPGSRVVADYLAGTGLQAHLDALGFQVTGFGCMTCVGFSGSLAPPVAAAIDAHTVRVAAVTSGNRNYAGRVHGQVGATFLCSPSLVVAYALAGNVGRDLTREPVGEDGEGRPVHLNELWPDAGEVERLVAGAVAAPLFVRSYASLYDGGERWQQLVHPRGPRFDWNPRSAVIRPPPDFLAADPHVDIASTGPQDLSGARILALYGDDVTTEHVSPMGPIPAGSTAAAYLRTLGIPDSALGTYAGRRLVADVMIRGTFSSPHLVNAMTPDAPGGHTRFHPDGELMTIHAAAQRYRAAGVPLVVLAGRRYGTGSSRDWSAKGPRALGVRAVIAVSFERLHRANLVAAGVLPLQFADPTAHATFTGAESVDVQGLASLRLPGATLAGSVRAADGTVRAMHFVAALETRQEVEHLRAGGTYHHLLRGRMRSRLLPTAPPSN